MIKEVYVICEGCLDLALACTLKDLCGLNVRVRVRDPRGGFGGALKSFIRELKMSCEEGRRDYLLLLVDNDKRKEVEEELQKIKNEGQCNVKERGERGREVKKGEKSVALVFFLHGNNLQHVEGLIRECLEEKSFRDALGRSEQCVKEIIESLRNKGINVKIADKLEEMLIKLEKVSTQLLLDVISLNLTEIKIQSGVVKYSVRSGEHVERDPCKPSSWTCPSEILTVMRELLKGCSLMEEYCELLRESLKEAQMN